MVWLIAMLAGVQQATAPDPVLTRMVALYNELCLKTFPDDKALDALMAAKGATALTPEQVKTTLRDDPGRGWSLPDGDRKFQIMLELPPYHACSVRRTVPGEFADLSAYRAVVAPYQASHPGFAPVNPMEADIGPYHAHLIGEQRALPNGGGEVLMIIDQHITDPERRAKGETAVDMRFVHQIKLGSD